MGPEKARVIKHGSLVSGLLAAGVKAEKIRKGMIFWGCSGLFGGYFWRSVPYTNPLTNGEKQEKTCEHNHTNKEQKHSSPYCSLVALCFDPYKVYVLHVISFAVPVAFQWLTCIFLQSCLFWLTFQWLI